MITSTLKLLRLVSLCCCGAVLAAPFANVPSVAPVGQAVNVFGGGLVPGSAITARVTGPNQDVSMAAAIVKADGSVSIQIMTSAPGSHAIDLIDPSGARVVSGLKLIASR